MNSIYPHKVFESDRKLPSDSVFRKDLISWCLLDGKKGQKYKEEIENI
jgi:hypothetical protein